MTSIKIQKICCIGAGYVGGPTMSVIADKCPDLVVRVIDINKERIDAWNDSDLNNLPIFEPGLKDLVVKNHLSGRLKFTTNLNLAVKSSEIIFICVGTPAIKNSNSVDLKYVFRVVKDLSLIHI